jgi:hypothetical protein
MSLKKQPRGRTAIVGGDGRRLKSLSYGPGTRVFPAARYGGNGLIRALCAALRAGRIDRVVLLIRFVDHPTSERIKRMCRRLGVPVERFAGCAPPDASGEPSDKKGE